ncbi:OsmC family protein [Flavobacterium sp. '19STA2R22 D10 B1']|uniref:OsmC family protein n=1 Tax=Flavobacterium aerium TaxID=3037261 RepID=UPI00278C8680|nr:OsmC family protein [Flavobacterium sp. '19STA2R22 D10 B1']
MKRHAIAIWEGSLKEGSGSLTTQSNVLNRTQYSFKTRFEQGNGTNPEELVGAAHAGCFTMQLTAYINEAGFAVDHIETKCDIDFRDGSIVGSHLAVVAKIREITQAKFDELVEKAEKNCPISRLLNTEITSDATLVQS